MCQKGWYRQEITYVILTDGCREKGNVGEHVCNKILSYLRKQFSLFGKVLHDFLKRQVKGENKCITKEEGTVLERS